MGRKLILLFVITVCLFSSALAIQDGEFKEGDKYWETYISSGSSVNFYPEPMPDPFVRICATKSGGYAGIYQEETKQNQGMTRAIFHLKSVSVGLNALVTIGWTDITGDFGSYYKEVDSSGTYEVDCTNTSFPFVTVQCDSSNIVNAIVEVDEIEVINPSPSPTPTSTPTPTPTPTPTATETPSDDFIQCTCDYITGQVEMTQKEKIKADWNKDGLINAADIVRMIIESQ